MKVSLLPVLLILVIGSAGVGYYFFKVKVNEEFSLLPTPTISPSPDMTTPTPTPSGTETKTPEIIKVTLRTVRGDIEIELYPKVASKTVANFTKLAGERFYDGTKFHRVITDFVIQGGDPLSKTDDLRVGSGGPGYTFEDEINPRALGIPEEAIKQLESLGYKYDFSLRSLPVDPGYLAMANAGPATNGSQFFIVTTKPQAHLYGRHTVFGKVVKGMDVVLKIQQGDTLTKIDIK